LHLEESAYIIDEPVSNITVRTYGGEPKAISPTYY
jgi:hypothetical protein